MSSVDTTSSTLEAFDSPTSASLTVPQGWTNEPGHMRLDYYWRGHDDLKAELEEDYGLADAQPLITRSPEFGDVYFVFQSNSMSAAGYYIWNGISQNVYQIVTPSNLEAIYRNMDEREGKLGGLEMVEVDVREEAEEGDEDEGEDEQAEEVEE